MNTHPTLEHRTDDPRWHAVASRRPIQGDRFVFGVVTTGIYCRPGCRARTPLRENVRFFDAPEAAERAGFRACRRCRPDQSNDAPADGASVLRLLLADATLTTRELSERLGIQAETLRRRFRRDVGVPLGRFRGLLRDEAFREALSTGRTVTEAIHEAGFGASSRAYDGVIGRTGMPPSDYRRRGRNQAIRFATAPCSLGRVLVAATEFGLCAVLLGDDDAALEADLAHRFGNARLERADAEFRDSVSAVIATIDEPDGNPALPLDLAGTAFQLRVWAALRAIPPGETVTYAELARRIGEPTAARAVAGACARNPVAVLVPCHRVCRQDGGLGGYRWGVERKRRLLAREAGRGLLESGAATHSESDTGDPDHGERDRRG